MVLLDFTVYQSAVAAPHNLMLRDLYNKYASQGLEIYQVSLDADEHFGKHQLIICLGYACAMRMEFTQPMQLCMAYRTCRLLLINRNNELRARGETVKDLERYYQVYALSCYKLEDFV